MAVKSHLPKSPEEYIREAYPSIIRMTHLDFGGIDFILVLDLDTSHSNVFRSLCGYGDSH
eukprot:m.124171 g.124171  ORF g.124171 m.124171 type:complete len:60 (-) comp14468_c0_seq3:229-408(-)